MSPPQNFAKKIVLRVRVDFHRESDRFAAEVRGCGRRNHAGRFAEPSRDDARLRTVETVRLFTHRIPETKRIDHPRPGRQQRAC